MAHARAHSLQPTVLLLTLAVASVAAVGLAMGVGSVPIPVDQVWYAVTGTATGPESQIVLDLRLPRALAAYVTGGLLALAGALMQVLLRNPLADPYVLGVSGGAAVGALGAMTLGMGAFAVSGMAFFAALASMLLVFGLAHGRGGWTPSRLLLTGVVVAAGWGAVISFILAMAPGQTIHGMLFWLMGDLSGTRSWLPGAAALGIGLLASLAVARSLNLLARGELQAGALGVSVAPLRLLVFGVSSLLTATAVTLAGTVGFVGLVVPHMLRLLGGGDHRLLLPTSVLGGGLLLVVADTLARSAFAPTTLPVGVVTALIGVPLFLYLLHRGR